jgi:hypothetical protein
MREKQLAILSAILLTQTGIHPTPVVAVKTNPDWITREADREKEEAENRERNPSRKRRLRRKP